MTRKATWIDGETSKEMRDAYMQLNFLPEASAMMARDDGVNSVLLVVAQFWADEADDAVHLESVPCTDLDPTWPDCVRDSAFYRLDEDYLELTERGQKATGWDLDWKTRPIYPELDSNNTAITAFASYCEELGNQDQSLDMSSTPYAIARRSVGEGGSLEVKLEVIGTMHRPEWEDHFDVGFSAPDGVTSGRLFGDWHEGAGRGKQGAARARAAAAASSARSGGSSKPTLWQRLLGRG